MAAKTITITNQKGGVGKTTISYQLGRALAKKGNKVLLLDNDPQGNLSESCLSGQVLDPEAHILNLYDENAVCPQNIHKDLDLIGSNISLAPVAERDFEVIYCLKEGLEFIKNKYDYIIIDSLPSFGYLHIASLMAADFILIPAKPSQYAISGLVDLFNSIKKVKKRLNSNLKILGIILNLLDTRKVILERDLEEELRQNYSNLIFENKLYKRIAYEEATSVNKYIGNYSDEKAKIEFNNFVSELISRIKGE